MNRKFSDHLFDADKAINSEVVQEDRNKITIEQLTEAI